MKQQLMTSLLLAATLTIPAWADSNSTTVPLNVISIGHNNYKVGIAVSVAGGPPSQVTFDTGGMGLHIFASQVGKQNITYTNKHISSSFGDSEGGFSFEGVIAYAPVTIGGVTTKPIPILVIQNVKCHGSGSCDFNMNNGQPPMFGNFYGELGAGMRTEQHGNAILSTPLRALPGNYGNGFIIENLSPNSQGQLVLGLTPQNTMGFNKVPLTQEGTYPDGKPYYNDKGLQVQYNIGDFSESLRTAFDTGGDASVNLFTGDAGLPVRRHHVVRGESFSASITNVFNWQFTTGNQEGVNKVLVLPPNRFKGRYVNTGILFFFSNNMLYDFNDGMLGFQNQSL